MLVKYLHSSNAVVEQEIHAPQAGEIAVYRRYSNNATTWAEWELVPRRDEANAIANRGGKNLLPNNIVSQTVNGLTVTKNADGSVTINGTATANTRLYMWNSQLQASPFEAGDTFLMSGCNGGSTETYRIQLLTNGTIRANCFDGDVTATIPASTTATQTVQFAIQVLSGVAMDNVTFYPMLRKSSVQDDTYVPYGMSNAELTEAVNGISFFAIAGNGTFSIPNNPKKYYILAWTVGNNYGGVNFLYTQSNNLNSPLIATRGEGNAPSITLDGTDMQIKNNNTSTYIRCLLIEGVKVLP